MIARAATCLALGLLMTGCPFAMEDDYYIDPTVGVTAVAPAVVAPVADVDAAVPKDAAPPDACAKMGPLSPCRPIECVTKVCPKMP